jgi:DNA polymerase-3 subunit beta
MFVVSLTQEEWLSALLKVSGIVDKKNTQPVLSNFLLDIKDSKIEFTASDSEIQIKTILNHSSENELYKTTISTRKVLDILKVLQPNDEIKISDDNGKITLQSGKSRFILQTLPALDFPLINEPEKEDCFFSIPQKTLKKMISNVSFSMATNDVRYYLNGVLFVIKEDLLSLVATDGHRLAYCEQELETQISLEQAFIVPRKTIIELQKLLDEKDDFVEIVFSKNQSKFILKNTEVITKLIDGKFPDYKRVIPVNQENHLIIDRLNFLRAIQKASVLTNEKFKGVRFFLEQGLMRVSSQNSEQEEAFDELDIEYAGDVIDIGFNVGYIFDVVSNLESKDIKISLSDSSGSALITIPGNDQFKYVVMPMRI